MKILNQGKVIAGKAWMSMGMFSNAWGLKFSRRLRKGQGLVLVAGRKSRFGTAIDMLFVFFAIDVAWLDSKKKVVDVKCCVRPFTPLVIPRKPAKYVVELPVGTARHIKPGNQLEFVN